MSDRPSMGFADPSKGQEAFEGIREQLAADKVSWQKIIETMKGFGDEISEIMATRQIPDDIAYTMQSISVSLLMFGALGTLGTELARIHERLARVEQLLETGLKAP